MPEASERDKQRIEEIAASQKRILELIHDSFEAVTRARSFTLGKIGTSDGIKKSFAFDITQISKDAFPDAIAKGMDDWQDGKQTIACEAVIKLTVCVHDYLEYIRCSKSDRTGRKDLQKSASLIMQHFQEVYDVMTNVQMAIGQKRLAQIVDTHIRSVPHEWKPVAEVYGPQLSNKEKEDEEEIKQMLKDQKPEDSDSNSPIGT